MSGLGRAVAGAGKALALVTFVACGVGLARQRRESARIRRGDLSPAFAASSTAPPPGEDRVSQALARWIPPLPQTSPGQTVALVVAAPLTLVGVALGVTTGGRWLRREDLGAWVVLGGERGAGRWQRWLGYDANAVGQVILCRLASPSRALLEHEAVHVRHAERLGPFLAPLYALLWARWGYRDHPLERAARAGARRTTG